MTRANFLSGDLVFQLLFKLIDYETALCVSYSAIKMLLAFNLTTYLFTKFGVGSHVIFKLLTLLF